MKNEKNIQFILSQTFDSLFTVADFIGRGANLYHPPRSSRAFLSEADQKLNLPLAQNMAFELRPFLEDSLSLPRIEDKIHYMMVMNPKIEIYLLNKSGKILAFFAESKKKIVKEVVDLQPVQRFLGGEQSRLILGDDPRNAHAQKPFSAAPISIGSADGYIYIILGGEQYDNAVKLVRESHILKTTFRGLLLTLVFAALIGLILFAFLTRRLRAMGEVVRQFEKGNFERRIAKVSEDEIGQLAHAFNHMADKIEANIDELKRTDQLRRELVANVSHDLRGPLASIQGYLETIMMKENTLTPEARREFLETILSNTTMLGRLVGELFELSKLDARQIQARPEVFSLAELVRDVVMKFSPRAQKMNIQLEAIQPPKLPLAMADIGLIERVLSNLIDNALNYTPANGRVKIVVSESGRDLRITISDTGRGISAEDLPKIFDRFYRAEKSRTPAPGGTGLGLAIAKKIVELHHRAIHVESEEGVGASFYFDLPIAIS